MAWGLSGVCQKKTVKRGKGKGWRKTRGVTRERNIGDTGVNGVFEGKKRGRGGPGRNKTAALKKKTILIGKVRGGGCRALLLRDAEFLILQKLGFTTRTAGELGKPFALTKKNGEVSRPRKGKKKRQRTKSANSTWSEQLGFGGR